MNTRKEIKSTGQTEDRDLLFVLLIYPRILRVFMDMLTPRRSPNSALHSRYTRRSSALPECPLGVFHPCL